MHHNIVTPAKKSLRNIGEVYAFGLAAVPLSYDRPRGRACGKSLVVC